MRRIHFAISLALTGCASATFNDGRTVVLEHDFFVSDESVLASAVRSCSQAGRTGAKLRMKASKNPLLPVGTGVVISTFDCT